MSWVRAYERAGLLHLLPPAGSGRRPLLLFSPRFTTGPEGFPEARVLEAMREMLPTCSCWYWRSGRVRMIPLIVDTGTERIGLCVSTTLVPQRRQWLPLLIALRRGVIQRAFLVHEDTCVLRDNAVLVLPLSVLLADLRKWIFEHRTPWETRRALARANRERRERRERRGRPACLAAPPWPRYYAGMQQTAISDIGRHVDQEVEIRGWLYNIRSKGKIAFLQLRDGSGRIQGVAEEAQCGAEGFALIGTLKMEASLIVRGQVRRDERAPSGFELTVKSITVVQNPADDYPIAKKEHGIDFLLENRHLWLRSSRPEAIMRIRDQAILSIRAFFHERGFLLIDTPILTGSIGESAGTLFTVPYFDLGDAYLAQTGQLYLEAACMAYGKVYDFGPTFRAEKSKTRRHLTEFWMLDAEVAYADSADNMRLQEDMVSRVVSDVVSHCGPELKVLERDVEPLKKVQPPFIRMDYGEAVKTLQGKGSSIQWGDDLGGEDETILTKMFEKPIFVMNYPKKAKAFYMKENPDNPDTVLCSDLLAPEGYGEIIGGSQREDVLEKLLGRIHEEKLPEEAYGWYLDLRKYGSVPHSGFGIGLERTLAWICGTQHIRETIPFPRTISRIYP